MVTRPARLVDARVAPIRKDSREPSGRGGRRPRPPRAALQALLLLSLASLACGPGGQASEDPALPAVSTAPERPAARPNVLFVVLDTVRADRLSVYGSERSTSPTLEALASRGTRFERAIASAPWTVPSHASMFTGLSPSEHGAHHEHRALAPEARTLAERLAEAGYRTAGFSANPFVGPTARLDQGFETFANLPTGRAVTDAALSYLDATPQPWFLLLNYMETHLPFSGVPDEAVARFAEEPTDPAKLLAFEEQFNAFAYACERRSPAPERMRALRSLYDGALAYLDSLLAEVLAGLGERRADTLVIVVADHGELLGEHGLIEHQFSLLDPLLRVPLIISWPGRLPEGLVYEPTVATRRLFDWVLAWSEGRGTLPRPAWLEEDPAPVVAEYYRPRQLLERVAQRFPECPERLDQRLTAVYDGRHKLVLSSTGRQWLYDLAQDPLEEHDLHSALPEQSERLAALARARQEAGAARLAAEEALPAVDSDTRRRLEALGYVGP